jgi:GNAT superfamily N-acetyltransferase
VNRRWIVRRYQPGDEAQILRLRRLVFGDLDEQRNTESYWRWEFLGNPAGSARTWLAVAADEIVGHYAVIPVRMRHGGENLMGSLSLETMTHPDYRRQAVFTSLASKVYEELAQAGISVTHGFPNENSVRGLVSKLDWLYISSLPVFVKPLRASRIVERYIGHRALASAMGKPSEFLAGLMFRPTDAFQGQGGSVRWIDRFDERMDAFWEQVAPRYQITVVRDSTYLNWRYLDNPGRRYRAVVAEDGDDILAYLMLRPVERLRLRGGMIVDLGARPGCEGMLGVLIGEAERYFETQNVDLVASLVCGQPEYVDVLKGRGFVRLPTWLGFKKWHFGCRLHTKALDSGIFADVSNWFVTFGDTDVI